MVPWKSSTVSLFWRALRTTSSYIATNWAKSSSSVCLMLGTTSWRLPSGLARSMAMPRLTCAGLRRTGLPSTSAKAAFISGIRPTASTTAQPMRWVNETLPPRALARWLLITVRLSMRSLAGTALTLVAVGTERLASMLSTTRAATPRSGTSSTSSRATAGAAGLSTWGAATGCAGAAGVCTGGDCVAVLSGGGGGGRARGRGRLGQGRVGGLVVGEELPPGRVDGVLVGQVLLVDLVDEPLVRAEAGQAARPGRTPVQGIPVQVTSRRSVVRAASTANTAA